MGDRVRVRVRGDSKLSYSGCKGLEDMAFFYNGHNVRGLARQAT